MTSCSEEHLCEAEDTLGGRLPERVRALFQAEDGRYRVGGEWWVIWPMDRLVAANVAAWREGTLPRELLAIGDDGTGDSFCVPLDGRDQVLRWSWIDVGIAGSEGALSDFILEWVSGSA